METWLWFALSYIMPIRALPLRIHSRLEVLLAHSPSLLLFLPSVRDLSEIGLDCTYLVSFRSSVGLQSSPRHTSFGGNPVHYIE